MNFNNSHQNTEAQLINHMTKNYCEPHYDQWFDPLDGSAHTFLLRNRPDDFAWYRGWWGNLNNGEVWVLIQYWVSSGGPLFTFVSHPHFLLDITALIIEQFKVKK